MQVNYMLPRPEISDLGVGYRRIPVLAIENDVYCDTSLITSVLEKRFPASSGYGTIYPTNSLGDSSSNAKTATGALNAFAFFLVELDLVRLGFSARVAWAEFPEDFLKDWSQVNIMILCNHLVVLYYLFLI
jgi:hypothetical protein